MNGRVHDEMLAEASGVDYDEYTADDNTLTEYDVWLHENEEDILIELAESGAYREPDFDLEAEFDKRYQQYLAKALLAKFVSKSKWYYITPAGTVDNFIVHSGISTKSAWVLSKVHTLYRTWEEANKALIEYNEVFTTFRAS